MPRRSYPEIGPGQPVAIPWRRQDYKVGCCDCGLVHRFRFSVKRGFVVLRAWRDNRATAQLRRHQWKRKTLAGLAAPPGAPLAQLTEEMLVDLAASIRSAGKKP